MRMTHCTYSVVIVQCSYDRMVFHLLLWGLLCNHLLGCGTLSQHTLYIQNLLYINDIKWLHKFQCLELFSIHKFVNRHCVMHRDRTYKSYMYVFKIKQLQFALDHERTDYHKHSYVFIHGKCRRRKLIKY